jgi:hypothetical protein
VEVDGPTLAATVVALVGGLGWALIGRVKRARRIFPRMRARIHFSMRTPSDPPEPELERDERLPAPLVLGDPRPTLPLDDEKTPTHRKRLRHGRDDDDEA